MTLQRAGLVDYTRGMHAARFATRFYFVAATLIVAICLCTWASGCARHVLKESDGGVIAISGPGGRKKAEKLMAERFPEGYDIVREEEVVVGQRIDYQEETKPLGVHLAAGEDHGVHVNLGGETRGTETVTDKTEYRIYYRRRGAE
ncbi:hypothetical protein [Alienimonas chondri]|uniref:DUF3465 domain-containing protein n=1 Tax=Alienimonas chondri TaxID=2681879 RepID=A0ABX1VGZ3_9PLAN|nr:hypothetical protein [Alienimonas chondri]NNJ27112.1 hypothetical protein [Alienimonas chondri]